MSDDWRIGREGHAPVPDPEWPVKLQSLLPSLLRPATKRVVPKSTGLIVAGHPARTEAGPPPLRQSAVVAASCAGNKVPLEGGDVTCAKGRISDA